MTRATTRAQDLEYGERTPTNFSTAPNGGCSVARRLVNNGAIVIRVCGGVRARSMYGTGYGRTGSGRLKP